MSEATTATGRQQETSEVTADTAATAMSEATTATEAAAEAEPAPQAAPATEAEAAPAPEAAAEAASGAAAGAAVEETLVLVKPDAMARRIAGQVMSRFEDAGFRLVASTTITPCAQLAEEHYAEHSGRPFFQELVRFTTSGPVLALVWKKINAVRAGRELLGVIRDDFREPGAPRCHNILHASDSVAAALSEKALWFD